ncbi:PepSY-associated TM helix domain-containing protein [Deinococcus roseus]|uniref:Peptidase n=1 Tax=Deinococcus roseus TaxID=392414 RepID=A0ABQ2CZ53_9DEIO|nr:PepSY-associated TM helix domain-containing protein [Deinococcus roseus]GGJ28718.1 peptidase [Deinococcus roseus]
MYGWFRWLHIYISMFSLLIILFFSVTGITLNHPDWVFGSVETRSEVKGTLPAGWNADQKVNWLKVVEYLRATNGVKGSVADGDYQSDDQQASVSFHAPGYAADAFIEMDTGKYTLNIDAQGAVAVLNDLHKGRDTSPAWKWVIDVSAGFLVLVSLSGLGLLIFLKKLRPAGLMTAVAGGALVLILMKLAS